MISLMAAGEPPDSALAEKLLHSLRSPNWGATVRLTSLLLDENSKEIVARVLSSRWGTGSWRAKKCMMLMANAGHPLDAAGAYHLRSSGRGGLRLLRKYLEDDLNRSTLKREIRAELAKDDRDSHGILEVRAGLATLLLELGVPPTNDLARTLLDSLAEQNASIAQSTFRELLSLPKTREFSIEALRHGLNKPSQNIRSRCALMLADAGVPVDGKIVEALADSPYESENILRALLAKHDEKLDVGRILRLKLIQDSNPFIAELLTEAGEPLGEYPLRALLKSRTERVEQLLAPRLADNSTASNLLKDLHGMLSDKEPEVATAAARFLLDSEQKVTLHMLARLTNELDVYSVRNAFEQELHGDLDIPRVKDLLMRGLNGKKSGRFPCAKLLLENGTPLNHEILNALLTEPNSHRVLDVLRDLIKRDDSKAFAVEALLTVVNESRAEPEVAIVLVEAGVSSNENVLNVLRDAADGPLAPEARSTLAALLSNAESAGLTRRVLRQALSSRNPSWSPMVCALLLCEAGEPPSPAMVWALLHDLGRRTDLTIEAADVLRRIVAQEKTQDAFGLVEFLLDALDGTRSRQAQNGLEHLLADKGVRPRVGQAVQSRLGDRSLQIRAVCRELLKVFK